MGHPAVFSRPRRRPAGRLGAGLALAALVGCAGEELGGGAGFAAPSAVVVAGVDGRRAFVLNDRTARVQVVELGAGLRSARAVPALARLHPLQLPAGPAPRALAAGDGGRRVYVLDGLEGRLRALDAENLLPVPSLAGGPAGARLADPRAGLVDLVAAPGGCAATAGCRARLWVAAAGAGLVGRVDVLADGEGPWRLADTIWQALPQMRPHRLAAWGGEGEERVLALDAGGELWLGDAAGQTLGRWSVGAGARDVVVDPEAQVAWVARPHHQDLVAVDLRRPAAADDPGWLALDPVATPLPRVVGRCATPGATWQAGAAFLHPADLGLCLDGGRLVRRAAGAYRALWLGSAPARLALLPAGGPARLAVACEDGLVRWVGYPPEEPQRAQAVRLPDAPAPSLTLLPATVAELDEAGRAAGVADAADPEALARAWIVGCGGAEAGARLPCLGGLAQVVPGGLRLAAGSTTMRLSLAWEGILARGRGQLVEGGAAFRAPAGGLDQPPRGTGTAVGEDPGALDANRPAAGPRPGDTLVVLAEPVVGEGCPAGEASPPERRLLAVEDAQRLLLDRPLPPACFPGTSRLPYAIRATGAFVARRQAAASGARAGPTVLARVPPGGRLGLGGLVGEPAGGERAVGLQLASPPPDLGAASPAAAAQWARGVGLSLHFSDEDEVLAVGALVARGEEGERRAAGSRPDGLAVATGAGGTVVLVSFGGRDRLLLLGADDLRAARAAGPDALHLLE